MDNECFLKAPREKSSWPETSKNDEWCVPFFFEESSKERVIGTDDAENTLVWL